jgi:hypothetical protein
MNQEVYINNILRPIVGEWAKDPQKWCLEEDGDSGHGKKENSNRVERFKKDLGMSRDQGANHSYYFNCPRSPDLSIIEDAWS